VSVGYESRAEYFDIELAGEPDCRDVARLAGTRCPEGFMLAEIRKIPSFLPSLESSANIAEYSVRGSGFSGSGEDIRKKIGEFLSKDSLVVEKTRKGRVKKVNIRPLVRRMSLEDDRVELVMFFGPGQNIKPEKAVAAVLGLDEDGEKLLRVTREGLFREQPSGKITGL